MTVRIGQLLGEYRLIQFLGKGSYAEVYLGEQIYLGTKVAIKVLHTQLIDQEDSFKKEARQIANLTHPNIVRVHNFAIDRKKQQPVPYLVMEYAPNGSILQRHPRGSRLTLQEIILYVKQIANALDFAHAHHVVHRDVKPENILIGQDDTLLLSDFGIAVVIGQEEDAPAAGTKAYIAPEQILKDPQPQSDQYALGIIVYEWLCGFPPFSIKDKPTTVVLEEHLYREVPPLSSTGLHIEPRVEQVMQRVLAKKPYQRYTTVSEFANELEKAFQETPMVTTLKAPTKDHISSPTATTIENLSRQNISAPPGKSQRSWANRGMIPPPTPQQRAPKPQNDMNNPLLKLDRRYLYARSWMAFRVTGLILTIRRLCLSA